MTRTHTPGPWHLVLSNNATPFVMHEHGDDWTDIQDLASIICIMPAEITRSYNSFANARLIAAAPGLFAAARAALHYMRLHKYADQAWADDLEAAIAAAMTPNAELGVED